MIVIPQTIKAELLLTTTTPVSHHDPALPNESNTNLFNRRAKLMPVVDDNFEGLNVEQKTALLQANPCPASIAPLLETLNVVEFGAVVLARQFIDLYNSLDGTGLFSGMGRYEMLQARLNQSAVKSRSLRNFWDSLCQAMLVRIHGGEHDEGLILLFAMPLPYQRAVLRTLAEKHNSVVAISRYWHSQAKLGIESYAEKMEVEIQEMVIPVVEGEFKNWQAPVIQMPEVSGNTIRHQIVREPAWLYFRKALGLTEMPPGQGMIPPGVESIFVNGGNIRQGAKQPAGAHDLAIRIRQLYPMLDLLGGTCDAFDLGKSRLDITGWIVCRENQDLGAFDHSLASDLPATRISVFDMLDDITETRQATRHGLGQMIRNFEVLIPGTQILVRMCLHPDTPVSTLGALVTAIGTYLENSAVVGGQAARGFGGWMSGEWLAEIPNSDIAAAVYSDYLEANSEQILDGMVSGRMGTETVVLS